MKQITIKGSHPAYTGRQLRAVVAWVLREMGIAPALSARWTVEVNDRVRGTGYSGCANGWRALLRFQRKPLPAQLRALHLVQLAAHELAHLEQYANNGNRWPRSASGRRTNLEPGARAVASMVRAAYEEQRDALLARWGFTPDELLPAPASAPARTPEQDAVRAATVALERHHVGCATCQEEWGYQRCPEARALIEARDAARGALRASQTAAGRAKAVEASRAAVARKAELRERRARAKLAEWEQRLRAAQAKVREYRAKVRYYDQKAAARRNGPAEVQL